MAGIPWGKYERGDWIRIPGGSRRYRNLRNPDITISRRQFDEHYGSASLFGTYEKKAKKNAGSNTQLLRPARGRKSALKLSAAEKEKELGRRKVVQAESKQQHLINRLVDKKNTIPKTISLRNFSKGKQIRKFRTPVDKEAIETIRAAGARSRIIFGYWVGLEMVSERDGQIKTPSLFSQRDINEPFTDEDFEAALQYAATKTYATLTGMWIALHLKRDAAIRNGVKPKQ